MTVYELIEKLQSFNQDEEVIVYCQRGARSIQAATILKEYGFTDVTSLSGGYIAWLESPKPFTEDPSLSAPID